MRAAEVKTLIRLFPALVALCVAMLAAVPSASAIPGACDTPPNLPPGGTVPDAYNAVRDGASDACHGVIDVADEQCERQLGALCPI